MNIKTFVKWVIYAVIITAMWLIIFQLTGCAQKMTKDLGGEITFDLEPNQKLEEITWKDDSLWYLTRPMRDGEDAETHIFQQSSNWGLIEGTVTIVEHKE